MQRVLKSRVTHVVNHRHCHKIVILYCRELRSKNNSTRIRSSIKLIFDSSSIFSHESVTRAFSPNCFSLSLSLSDIFYMLYLRARDPILRRSEDIGDRLVKSRGFTLLRNREHAAISNCTHARQGNSRMLYSFYSLYSLLRGRFD